MAYAAAPAARPLAEAPAPAEEARAPPTIDSHGGKLTPITCFGCGPDGVTALLVQLALLSTLAPRGFKLTSRAFDLSVVRLAPGLLFTAALGWNLLPSLGAEYEAPAKFHLAGAVSDLMAVVLAAVAFFGLVSDALMPAREHSPARAIAAMAAAALSMFALLLAAGVAVGRLMNDDVLAFDGWQFVAGLLGAFAGAGILLLWRRFDGWRFNLLLVAGSLGLTFVGGALWFDLSRLLLVFMTIALTVTAALGFGLRGMGLATWQGLSGRAAWVLGWILRILTVLGLGTWVVF